MPTDLERFRDHCRKMAGPPVAPGCPAARERALWLRLADEVDAYLADRHDDAGLFDHPAPPRRPTPLPNPVIT